MQPAPRCSTTSATPTQTRRSCSPPSAQLTAMAHIGYARVSTIDQHPEIRHRLDGNQRPVWSVRACRLASEVQAADPAGRGRDVAADRDGRSPASVLRHAFFGNVETASWLSLAEDHAFITPARMFSSRSGSRPCRAGRRRLLLELAQLSRDRTSGSDQDPSPRPAAPHARPVRADAPRQRSQGAGLVRSRRPGTSWRPCGVPEVRRSYELQRCVRARRRHDDHLCLSVCSI